MFLGIAKTHKNPQDPITTIYSLVVFTQILRSSGLVPYLLPMAPSLVGKKYKLPAVKPPNYKKLDLCIIFAGESVTLRGPLVDKEKSEYNNITESFQNLFHEFSEVDFGRKFSLQLVLWLDSFPLVPKTVFAIKQPDDKKGTIVLSVSVGATFVRFR